MALLHVQNMLPETPASSTPSRTLQQRAGGTGDGVRKSVGDAVGRGAGDGVG